LPVEVIKASLGKLAGGGILGAQAWCVVTGPAQTARTIHPMTTTVTAEQHGKTPYLDNHF
jgi:hypothetical protein